jgi:hypothetical protein
MQVRNLKELRDFVCEWKSSRRDCLRKQYLMDLTFCQEQVGRFRVPSRRLRSLQRRNNLPQSAGDLFGGSSGRELH